MRNLVFILIAFIAAVTFIRVYADSGEVITETPETITTLSARGSSPAPADSPVSGALE
jgi:hypothetical protein